MQQSLAILFSVLLIWQPLAEPVYRSCGCGEFAQHGPQPTSVDNATQCCGGSDDQAERPVPIDSPEREAPCDGCDCPLGCSCLGKVPLALGGVSGLKTVLENVVLLSFNGDRPLESPHLRGLKRPPRELTTA
jgi:hypothetical protein